MPLAAIALFGLNNLVLKAAIGNAWTGKLSDVTCCFFLPLFLSATFGYLGARASVARRTAVGAVITAVVLTAVKTTPTASDLLNTTLAFVLSPLGVATGNVVDPTDLLALPLSVAAVLYVRCRFPQDRGAD